MLFRSPIVGVAGNALDLQKAIEMLDSIEVGLSLIHIYLIYWLKSKQGVKALHHGRKRMNRGATPLPSN